MNVVVKNGIDVKKQVMGGKKGEYFTANLEKRDTYYVNQNVTVWRIVFDNLTTGERLYKDFVRQMWIGRTAGLQEGSAKLVIAGDNKVSRTHCTIYEDGGQLYVQDLNSRNHTYLNGKIITDAVRLRGSDIIKVGDTRLKVQYSIIKEGSHDRMYDWQ